MLENIVLRLVHYVLALGVFVKQWAYYFPYVGFAFQRKTVTGSLQSDARGLTKLPIHLGILVLENDISYHDIANIIVWSITLGISYISVYDTNGVFKRNKRLLQEEIDKCRQEILDHGKYDVHIHSSFTDRRNIQHNGCHTGSSNIHIQLLSVDDGRLDLVRTAREICRDAADKKRRIEDISPQNIDNLLQEIHKMPDPDLVLKFGQVESLLGYLPWQTRLTEIISLPSHIALRYKSYISSLRVFSKINQRFGK